MRVSVILLSFLLIVVSCKKNAIEKNKEQPTEIVFPNKKLDSILSHVPAELTMVIKDLQTQKTYTFNKKRAENQFTIASTFKMLNSLIALEEGVIKETDTIKWDGIERPFIKEWNQDQTLASAYKNSVVWFYQEIARKLDKETYQKYLNSTNLGNKTIGENIDAFWLDGSLQISTIEQIEFLEKLATKELPFSEETLSKGKKIMTESTTDSTKLIAKTGMYFTDKNNGGWYVGYVEKYQKPQLAFALNMELPHDSLRNYRKQIPHQILELLDYNFK